MTRSRTYRRLVLSAVACCLSLLFAAQTKAQETVAITCTGTTVCNAAAGAFATQSTSTNPPTFTVSNTDGTKCGTGDTCEANLVVLVPGGMLPAGFTVNGSAATATGTFTVASANLFAALGEIGGQDNTFTPWHDSSIAAGTPAFTFYTVYEFPLGTFTGPGSFSAAITLSGKVPVGTGFAAFYEDTLGEPTTEGAIVNNTKLSESLVVTPEPGSLALFGTGLLVLGGAIRRRWQKQV